MLRSKNITYRGYQFLVLEVKLPADGLSRSPNWCFDYQYLCEEFHRRPTGCGDGHGRGSDTHLTSCRDNYNSDMANGDVLGCNPSSGVALLGNKAFPNLKYHATYNNSFGFLFCQTECIKIIRGSDNALAYVHAFWLSGIATMYTVCL